MSFLKDVLARDGEAARSASDRLRSARFRGPGGGRLESAYAESLGSAIDSNFAAGSPGAHNEAVVLLDVRPSLLIRDDGFTPPASPVWRDRLTTAAARIRSAIPSVGRIETANHPNPIIATLKFVGTAWMVTDRIAVTNSHVAHLLGLKIGGEVRLMSDALRLRIDFLEEYEARQAREASVSTIRYMAEDPDHDIAFLLLAERQPLPPPIHLGDHREEEYIATIGYPGRDDRVPAGFSAQIGDIFDGIYEVKRLAPGTVMPGGGDGILKHDASTLKGSSGSACISLDSGRAVGLHFAGEFMRENRAVTAATLKRKLRDLGIEGPVVPVVIPRPAGPAAEAARPSGREGYLDDFLCEDDDDAEMRSALTVPLPGAARNRGIVLPYTHFSVVMHPERRFAVCAAVNVEGTQLRRVPRSNRFVIDERAGPGGQFDDAIYRNNAYDRGHLVRRLDPVWGDEATARQANDDTFFFTNIAPQHEMLNQNIWSQLEDYVLDNAEAHAMRISVFTGCVFDAADPPYRGAMIPRSFWKIVAFRGANTGKLRASGYLLDQSALIGDVQESFAFGAFRTYQLSIAAIAARTGLSLGHLVAADVVGPAESFAMVPLQRISDARY